MSNIGDALTRKLGPLPAWAWAIIAFGLVWYYRRRFGSAASTTTSSTTPATIPPTLSPVPLSPGESVYDPNSGLLTSTPGALQAVTGGNGSGSTAGAPDLATAMEDLAGAMNNALTTAPTDPGASPTGQKGMTQAQKAKWNKKFNAQFNRNWLKQHPRRKAKAKDKVKATRIKIGSGVTRARSHANVKTSLRGNPQHTISPSHGRSRTITAAAKQVTQRHRPTTPVKTQVTRQRPVASHPARPPVAHNTPHQQTTQRKTAPVARKGRRK